MYVNVYIFHPLPAVVFNILETGMLICDSMKYFYRTQDLSQNTYESYSHYLYVMISTFGPFVDQFYTVNEIFTCSTSKKTNAQWMVLRFRIQAYLSWVKRIRKFSHAIKINQSIFSVAKRVINTTLEVSFFQRVI